MLNRLLHSLSYGLFGSPEQPAALKPVAVVERGIAEHLNPGAPFIDGDTDRPVPRWPEHGAAMVAASPEELLESQSDLVLKLMDSSPLAPARFNELVRPALLRYAAWVHLLPASEQHHHFGPGGLLRHGLEVAVHAARMADGKQVGMDLVPADRNLYAPRWKLATMFGGLLHDIGKPLVDCGATDPSRQHTWPAQAGPLSEWLRERNLTHYRIYWRAGARHERHKAIGTSVAREILGKDLLKWLAEEPSHEVVDLMMLSIAQGRTANNLMSQIVSKADSMSVEEDLRQLAKRTQSSAQGGSASNCSRIIAELRDMVEAGKIPINRPGEPLWWTSEGLFAIYPRILDDVLPKLVAKQIPGIPASKAEIAAILAETGFLKTAEAETVDGKQTANTWDLTVTIESKGEPIATHKLRTIRFIEPELIAGNRPLPPPVKAVAKPPFVDVATIDKNMEAVKVVPAPNAAPALEGQPPTEAQNPSETVRADVATPAGETEPKSGAASFVPSLEVTGASAGGRDRRDIADARSPERAISREKKGIPEALGLDELLERVGNAGMEGMAMREILDRISDARMTFLEDYTDTLDGLAVRYPDGFDGLGIAPADLMTMFGQKGWLVVESGSDRKINERSFGEARKKCLIFGGQPGKTWEVMKKERPAVLTVRQKPKADPKPSESLDSSSSEPTQPAPSTTAAQRSARDHESRSGERGQRAQTPARRPDPRPRTDDPSNAVADPARPRKPVEPTSPPTPRQAERPRPNPAQQLIAAETLSDLTPERSLEIKHAAYLSMARDLANDGMTLQDASSDQLKELLRSFGKRNGVALAPLCKAVLDDPKLIFGATPPMWDFDSLGEIYLHPHFRVRPEYEKALEKYIAKLKSERDTQGDKQ